jgi:hypothetical protein
MTLLYNRLDLIARDIFFATRLDKNTRAFDPSDKKPLAIFHPKVSDETQTVFLKDFLKATLSSRHDHDDGFDNRARTLKALRDLIVHPRSFKYIFEADGTIREEPTKQHEFVLEVFPEVLNSNGKITLSQDMVQKSIDDAREVVRRVVERCEYDYLYLFDDVSGA